MVVIRMESVSKTYYSSFLRRKTEALQDLSLEVCQGQTLALVGPNGAGKSTTLKLITGLLRPTSGKITLFGYPPKRPEGKRMMGFLPELPSYYGHLTAHEILTYYGKLFGIRSDLLKMRTQHLLEIVGLGGAKRTQVRKFSKGMLQRLGIAQALIGDPNLLILDEPMSGLDPVGRKEIRDIILQLRGCTRTMIVSSHILSDVEAVCDHVAFLMKGKLTTWGPMHEVVGDETSHIEIEACDVPQSALESLRALDPDLSVPGDGRVFVTTPGIPESKRVQEIVCGAGGVLVSVIPHRPSLEDRFMHEVLRLSRESIGPGGPREEKLPTAAKVSTSHLSEFEEEEGGAIPGKNAGLATGREHRKRLAPAAEESEDWDIDSVERE